MMVKKKEKKVSNQTRKKKKLRHKVDTDYYYQSDLPSFAK